MGGGGGGSGAGGGGAGGGGVGGGVGVGVGGGGVGGGVGGDGGGCGGEGSGGGVGGGVGGGGVSSSRRRRRFGDAAPSHGMDRGRGLVVDNDGCDCARLLGTPHLVEKEHRETGHTHKHVSKKIGPRNMLCSKKQRNTCEREIRLLSKPIPKKETQP